MQSRQEAETIGGLGFLGLLGTDSKKEKNKGG